MHSIQKVQVQEDSYWRGNGFIISKLKIIELKREELPVLCTVQFHILEQNKYREQIMNQCPPSCLLTRAKWAWRMLWEQNPSCVSAVGRRNLHPRSKGHWFLLPVSEARERGRGEERRRISPWRAPPPGRIRCSGYEVKKICPPNFVTFPAVSIIHQPLGGVYSLKPLSVGKQLLFSPHLFIKVIVCHTAFLLHKIMLELCRKVEDTCQRASSLTVYVLKLYAPLFSLLLLAELRHDKIKPAGNNRRRDN